MSVSRNGRTLSRRVGLFKHSYGGRTLGTAILFNMDAQVDYLVSELRSNYALVDAVLRNPGTSLEGASDEVVYSFEIPAAVLGPNRQRLPRSHPSVQQVLQRRRNRSRTALQAYRAAYPEQFAMGDEAEGTDQQEFETMNEEYPGARALR